MCHTVQKQAKIKQNSRENQTKLTLLNPKKNKQVLQNSTKKSNKINTVKPKEKQTIFYWKWVQKYFENFTAQHIRISQYLWKFLKWNFFFKLFFYVVQKKIKKIVFLARFGFKMNEGGGTGGRRAPQYTLGVFFAVKTTELTIGSSVKVFSRQKCVFQNFAKNIHPYSKTLSQYHSVNRARSITWDDDFEPTIITN